MDYFDDDYEEDADQFADIAIQTHLLRAEKIRLQEKLELRRFEIQNEIDEAQNKLKEAQKMLSDTKFSSKYSDPIIQNTEIKTAPSFPHPKTITNMHTEKELYAAQNKLELVNDDYNAQCERQKNEIQKLLKKAKKKKLMLESKIENFEKKENQNNNELEINQKIQIKIHQAKNKKKLLEKEANQIEQEVMKLIQEAETIVSKRYRGKSKQIK